MRKPSKKKSTTQLKVSVTEASENVLDENCDKVSEQSDEVDVEVSTSIEVPRGRRGRKSGAAAAGGKVSDEVKVDNQGKKRVPRGKTSGSDSVAENSTEIIDSEAVVCSDEQSEKIVVADDAESTNILTNNEAITTEPTQIDDKEDVEAVSDPSIEGSTEAIVLSEVPNTSSVEMENPQVIADDASEESNKVTAETTVKSDAGTKRPNMDDDAKSSTDDITEDVGENKRQKLDTADTTKADDDTSQTNNTLLRKVFVGGLPNTITEEKLREHFEKFGRVLQVNLIREHATNRIRGFAFIVFEKEDCANTCIELRTHEICQTLCDVRKVHKNPFHNNKGFNNRRSTGFNNPASNPRFNHHQNFRSTFTNNGMNVQRVFQQALRRQQYTYRPPVPPTSRFLLNRPPIVNHVAPLVNPLAAAVQRNNIFLQALLNRPAVAQPMITLPSRPVMTRPVVHRPPGNIGVFNQFAQHMKGYINMANRGPSRGAKPVYRPY